jgi:dynein intermediate chain 2
MLEREAKREKTLESSAREKRLKAQAQQKKPGSQSKLNAEAQAEESLKLAEEEFAKLLQAK